MQIVVLVDVDRLLGLLRTVGTHTEGEMSARWEGNGTGVTPKLRETSSSQIEWIHRNVGKK